MLHINLADPYWKMYTIVIQLGAILALIFLFLGRILEFIRTFPKGESGNRTALNHPLSLTLIAFFCTAIPAFLLTKVIGKHLESLRLMATSLLVGGIIMWVVDAWSVRQVATTEDVEHMTLGQAIWIGLCQVTSAVFPGTSRSMSTIAAGQLVHMTRSAALEFSFLVSIPTMVAATGYDLLRTLHPRHTDVAEAIAPLVITGHGWLVLLIGFAVSFIIALLVVEWFLMWVRRHGFVIFAVYRIALAILLLTFAKHFIGT
jgi:undecaprenyl-diphosphatase